MIDNLNSVPAAATVSFMPLLPPHEAEEPPVSRGPSDIRASDDSAVRGRFPTAGTHAPLQSEKEQVERRLMRLYAELADILQYVLADMEVDQGRQQATLSDLHEVTSLLRTADVSVAGAIPASEYDKQITLDPRSLAGTGLLSVKNVLLRYGIQKEGDAMPTTHEQLKALIDKIENRSTALASTAQLTAFQLQKISSSREQAFSMTSNMSRQFIETLLNIIKRLGAS